MSACSTDLTVNTGLILGRSGAAGAADSSRYSWHPEATSYHPIPPLLCLCSEHILWAGHL